MGLFGLFTIIAFVLGEKAWANSSGSKTQSLEETGYRPFPVSYKWQWYYYWQQSDLISILTAFGDGLSGT